MARDQPTTEIVLTWAAAGFMETTKSSVEAAPPVWAARQSGHEGEHQDARGVVASGHRRAGSQSLRGTSTVAHDANAWDLCVRARELAGST